MRADLLAFRERLLDKKSGCFSFVEFLQDSYSPRTPNFLRKIGRMIIQTIIPTVKIPDDNEVLDPVSEAHGLGLIFELGNLMRQNLEGVANTERFHVNPDSLRDILAPFLESSLGLECCRDSSEIFAAVSSRSRADFDRLRKKHGDKFVAVMEAFVQGIQDARRLPDAQYRVSGKELLFLLIGIGIKEERFERFDSGLEVKREFEKIFPRCGITDRTFHRTWRKLDLPQAASLSSLRAKRATK